MKFLFMELCGKANQGEVGRIWCDITDKYAKSEVLITY
jgi:hypothetical protein